MNLWRSRAGQLTRLRVTEDLQAVDLRARSWHEWEIRVVIGERPLTLRAQDVRIVDDTPRGGVRDFILPVDEAHNLCPRVWQDSDQRAHRCHKEPGWHRSHVCQCGGRPPLRRGK